MLHVINLSARPTLISLISPGAHVKNSYQVMQILHVGHNDELVHQICRTQDSESGELRSNQMNHRILYSSKNSYYKLQTLTQINQTMN